MVYMGRSTYLPREKMTDRGVDALSDTDLMAVILGSGVEGRSVFTLARSAIRKVSRLRGKEDEALKRWHEFEAIDGIGSVKAMQLVCMLELGRRVWEGGECKKILRGRDDVVRMFRYLDRRKQEHVVVVAVNARNEFIGKKTVAIGSLNKSIIEARDIFSWVLERNAAGIILVHNHPSGDRSPSVADEKFTKRVREAADLLGIELIDHVII